MEAEIRLMSRRMRDGAEHIARGVAEMCQEMGDPGGAAVARAIADGIAILPLFGDDRGDDREYLRSRIPVHPGVTREQDSGDVPA